MHLQLFFGTFQKSISISTQVVAPGRRGDLPLLQGARVLRQPRLQCAGGPLRVSATSFEHCRTIWTISTLFPTGRA